MSFDTLLDRIAEKLLIKLENFINKLDEEALAEFFNKLEMKGDPTGSDD